MSRHLDTTTGNSYLIVVMNYAPGKYIIVFSPLNYNSSELNESILRQRSISLAHK